MLPPMPSSLAQQLRRHWTLDPAVRYLNHGSFGATPRRVLDRQAALRAQLEAQPVAFYLDALEPLLDASRDTLATLLRADSSALVFVANATAGVNTVLRSVALQRGDRVLTTDHAYRACANALDAVAADTGAIVDVVTLPYPVPSPDAIVDAVLRAVRPGTRLAMLDHVTSATGVVLPIATLAPALEARGVATLIDAAHAPGMLALDLPALGASWVVGNAHKWLCAPKGAGFLWTRADRQSTLRPLVVSHGASLTDGRRPRLHTLFDWAGTVDPTPWICVGTAIETMAEIGHEIARATGASSSSAPTNASIDEGWRVLQAHNRALTLAGRDLLCEALEVAPPVDDRCIGSLAVVPLPPDPDPPSSHPYRPHRLQLHLREHYGIEVPIVTWPAWPGRLVRISGQAYVGVEDLHVLSAALRETRFASFGAY
jgi:isopenicillin-N epimerase